MISPLVALMADQVAGLEARGISCCVAVTGLLSMPERADALDRVRLGDAGILLVSPEQLRAPSLRRALRQREIGAWVLDEAHCLSRWGHDFRPDYLYVGRFIGERAVDGEVPPVLCLTATAKPDVVDDITRHFRDRLGIELAVVNGGVERSNLTFEVMPTSGGEKFADIHQVLTSHLPPEASGGAIIYCATRRQSEEVAEFLQLKGVAAGYFHAGLPPETKKDVQQRFINGELTAIVATNAFGMGIDKPDVRLVIHADIPGSLENYLQEAGRAGRDRAAARCVLLYAKDDVERQFGMSARSRLTRAEVHGILRALRNLDRKKRMGGEVVATAGEILGEDEERVFERDTATDDTRVRTAVAWLEQARLLTREENRVQVFPSSLRVQSADEARARLRQARITDAYRGQLERVAAAMIDARPDEGLSTDDLMGVSGLSPEGVRHALYDLERLGIASNDTVLTAFVHAGVERSSLKRFEAAAELETALIRHMREAAPDLGKGGTSSLHLRVASQVLRDEGLADPLPERLVAHRPRHRLRRPRRGRRRRQPDRAQARRRNRAGDAAPRVESAGGDRANPAERRQALAGTPPGLSAAKRPRHGPPGGNHFGAAHPCPGVRPGDQEQGPAYCETAGPRPAVAARTGSHPPQQGLDGLPPGHDHPPATGAAGLHQRRLRALGAPLPRASPADPRDGGVRTSAAWRPSPRRPGWRWNTSPSNRRSSWNAGCPDAAARSERQTTPASWTAIVEDLKHPVQQRIVADDREQTNVLVLAGPGSGKTRVLVHRIAYLIRARRENARGILALAYNRHAAVDIRRRLAQLIGDDARGVTVMTCHALAMRLAGASFTGREERPDDEMFRDVLRRAIDLLRGQGLPPEDADEQRARLLGGFRWILVDEYQDIAADQYELISALAGRTLEDEAGKLTVFAVGDDDQNIYAFNGASVEYIRRFQQDYGPRPVHLVENYRSTAHIVDAANAVIEPARQRMKTAHPIRINAARAKEAPGGAWEVDPVGRGRVQILPVAGDPVAQARAVMAEFQRLSDLSPDWDWARCAVIAREWSYLVSVRAFCEANEIPVQMGNEEIPGFWRLRETRTLVEWLRQRDSGLVDGASLRKWAEAQPSNRWHELLGQAIDEHALETAGGEVPVDHFIEWLAEWGREIRRRQRGLLLLTAHRAKGLEFDHVAVLDGGWERVGRDEDRDAPRRLYYVAMTRARETLALARFEGTHPFQDTLSKRPSVLRREPAAPSPCSPALRYRYVQPSLGEVDLGFAGRQPLHHSTHRAIDRLSPGDALTTRVVNGGRWELLDLPTGTTVGRLAASFEPPPDTRCRSATVLAIVRWSRETSDPKYRDTLKCETWEVVVPELVFEPVDT